MAALEGGKDEQQSAVFPGFVSLHPPCQPTCPLPSPSTLLCIHPTAPSTDHTQGSDTKIKGDALPQDLTPALHRGVGVGSGGRGNDRDVMRGQRWMRYFVTWKTQLLPQRLQSK